MIDETRLATVTVLDRGCHLPGEHMCVMEAVAYVASEPWSDTPECVSPVIGAFMRTWNEDLPNAERTGLLLPLIPKLVGTRGTASLEERRSLMAADWLVRVHTPAWLRLAKLDAQAEALERLPEITSLAQVSGIRSQIEALRSDAASAVAAVAVSSAKATTGAAARDAAWAAWQTAGVVSQSDRDTAWAVWDIAGNAARASPGYTVSETKARLQQSAAQLVIRMAEARDE